MSGVDFVTPDAVFVSSCHPGASSYNHLPPVLFLLFLAQVWGATCPRAAMGRIDVSSDDRGLGACFEAAHITADWRGLYVSHHKVVTLDDYIYMIDSTAWEKSLESHLQQVTGLRDNRIALARFKSAYEAGLQALRAAASPNHKIEDPDEPLPDTTVAQMNQDWTRRYNLQFDASIEPSESLRGRVYREFKRGTMTVIEAKKIKSVLHMAAPRLNETVDLAGGLQLNFLPCQ